MNIDLDQVKKRHQEEIEALKKCIEMSQQIQAEIKELTLERNQLWMEQKRLLSIIDEMDQ